jgi:signal peptidase II
MTKHEAVMAEARRKAFCISVIFIVLIFDQLSKWMVMELIMRHSQTGTALDFFDWIAQVPDKPDFMRFEILPFYNIVLVWNYGVSFGMFNNQSPENALLLSGISTLIAFGLMLWMFDNKNRYMSIGLALAIGGAFGNIVDRMRFGAVIDFIDIHAYGFHWPAFNIADSCIVIGIGIVILHSLFWDKDATTLEVAEPKTKATTKAIKTKKTTKTKTPKTKDDKKS